MTEPSGEPPAAGTPHASPGRAFAVYSALRLVILAVSYAVLLAIGLRGLLAVGIAVLLSALLSLVLLRERRDAFTQASMARAAQRRQVQAQRRARLDAPDDLPGDTPSAPDRTPP